MERAEANWVGLSILAHAALFGLIAMLRGAPPPEVPAPMEVSFVDEAGLTTRSPATSPPEQGMAPEAGPAEDGAPSLPVAAPPEPLPDPNLPPLTSGPRQRPEPPRQRPQRELPRPDRARQAAPSPAGAGERPRRPLIGDDILKGLGRDPSPSRSQQAPTAMSGEARASMNALIARALARCEGQTFPSPEARAIRVTVRVELNRDGSLANAAVTRVNEYDSRLRQYEQRMRDLALAVVRGCTPIRGLPAQYYDVPRGWKQFSYQFPRQS